ncbi:hypothetical protein AB3N04_00460 (plasmid) [Alkalihalophilus sp. As8PL]|uniref:Uncharacterized protein n=1 Tax=Alkalihalophilus sp. As8PL TaxID=3237103 RepID=A0AB39BP01_9BACI
MSSVWGFALSFITISLIFYYFYLTRTKSIEETKKWKKASFISGAILFFIAHKVSIKSRHVKSSTSYNTTNT